MRTKIVFYNLLSEGIMQIVTLTAGLILPRLLLINYGSSINGLRASVCQFIGYLYLIEMGLSGAINFSLYKPIVGNNIAKINYILSAARQSYMKIGVYFLSMVIIIGIVYPLIIRKEEIDKITMFVLILSIGAAAVINYFTIAKYNVFLMAMQHNYVVSIIRVIYIIFNTMIMIFLIRFKLNISTVYLLSLSANIIQVIITKIYIKKKFSDINFNLKADISIIKKRYDVLLHQVSGMIVFNVPVLLITIFCTLKDVSVYSIYAMIFSSVSMIVGVISNGFMSSLGHIIAIKNKYILKEVYSQYEFLVYIFVTILYSCIIILGIPFIKIYTDGINDANYNQPIILTLFTIIGLLNSFKVPQTTIIIAAGHFTETRYRAIYEAIITLVSSITLVLFIGLNGVLIGSIIGLGYRSMDIYYAKRITSIPFKNTFYRLIRGLFILIITTMPFFTITHIKPSNLWQWMIEATVILIWSGSITTFINCFFEKNVANKIFLRLINLKT